MSLVLYTAETYERVRRLLECLCATQSRGNPVTYKISKYGAKTDVYSVQSYGREVYLIGGDVFEMESDGFNVWTEKDKEVLVEFFRFATDKPVESKTDGADAEWTEVRHIEFDVGSIVCNDRRMGSLVVSNYRHGLEVVSNVLRKFIRIDGHDSKDERFEGSLVDVLSLSRVL